MREAVKSAKRFVAASVWNDFIIGPAGDYALANTDDEIDAYARNTTTTTWHPAGSAAMSRCGAQTGVVDADLRVKGVQGLRVVDASVLVSRNVCMIILISQASILCAALSSSGSSFSINIHSGRTCGRLDQGNTGNWGNLV